MAQFWVNDTPGGPGPFPCQQTMDHGDERGWWGSSCSFVGLQDTHNPFWGSYLGRVALGRAGCSLSCLASPQHSLREHPQPPRHQAGSGGGLRAASSCGCPTLICCQMCVTTPRAETGGCTGAQRPWSVWGGRVTCHHHSPVCRGAGTGDKVPQSITQLTSCQERK